jgi:hypothetical protein
MTSGTGVTISIEPEIGPAVRIKRSEPLHAVSDRIIWRRTVCQRRGRCTVIAGTIIAGAVGGGQRSTHDCASDNPSGNGGTPSPASTSPLHGLGSARDRFDDRKRFADGPAFAVSTITTKLAANNAETARIRTDFDIGRCLQGWMIKSPRVIISEPAGRCQDKLWRRENITQSRHGLRSAPQRSWRPAARQTVRLRTFLSGCVNCGTSRRSELV